MRLDHRYPRLDVLVWVDSLEFLDAVMPAIHYRMHWSGIH